MEVYQAHELEPEAGDSSRAARESYPEFVRDRLDRMETLAECPAYCRNAANFYPLLLVLSCDVVMLYNYYGLITIFSPKFPNALGTPDTGFTPSKPCTIARRVMIRGSVNWNRPVNVSERSKSFCARKASSCP